MKKLMMLFALLGVVALVFSLAVGVVSSLSALEIEPEPELDPDPPRDPGGETEGEPEAASGTATRIDFEFTDDVALEGRYVVRDVVSGANVAEWYAQDGWRDSGWLNDLEISRENSWVEVLYYADPGAEAIKMKILNHAPNTDFGWLSKGMEHALEVEFPDSAHVAYGTGVQPVQPVSVGGVYGNIPKVGNQPAAPAPVVAYQPVMPAGEQVYVVQPGNNLFRIGMRFNCSYPKLAAFNGIPNPDRIYVGQAIRIPTNCGG